MCSKTCVKQPLSKRQKIGFQNQLSLNAGQKYCRMLQGEHSAILSGDNCIQNFHLGRYIVGYKVGNLVLRRRESEAVKHDFGASIRLYTSKMKILNMVIPSLMHFCSLLPIGALQAT